MNSQSDPPKPLQPAEFYTLLALSGSDLHAYALKGSIYNLSLNSVSLPGSNLSRLLRRLEAESFIDRTGEFASGKSGKLRPHYAINHHGTLRLKEELVRLNHAIKVAKNIGLAANT